MPHYADRGVYIPSDYGYRHLFTEGLAGVSTELKIAGAVSGYYTKLYAVNFGQPSGCNVTILSGTTDLLTINLVTGENKFKTFYPSALKGELGEQIRITCNFNPSKTFYVTAIFTWEKE